jgi:hypothetical protein
VRDFVVERVTTGRHIGVVLAFRGLAYRRGVRYDFGKLASRSVGEGAEVCPVVGIARLLRKVVNEMIKPKQKARLF